MERQYQFQTTITTRGSGGRKLPSQRANNLPKVEDLIVARWFSAILVDNQMQVCNLFIDRFCLGPLAVWKVNSQEWFTQARPKNQPTHWPTKVMHNCWAEPTMDCLVKPKTIKNGYAKSRTIARQSRQIIAQWSQGQLRTVTQKTEVANKQSRKQSIKQEAKQPNENSCLVRPKTIKQPKTKWINNWNQRFDKAKCNWTSNQTIKVNNFGKSWDQSKSNWSNNYNHCQYCRWYWIRSGVGQRFGSGAKGLELVRDREPTKKAWYWGG